MGTNRIQRIASGSIWNFLFLKIYYGPFKVTVTILSQSSQWSA